LTTTICLSFAFGCPRAEVDTARLHDYIQANGWELARRLEDADVVLVVTCGFNAEYEERSLSVLDSADARRKPGSRLVVLGCLAEIDGDLLRTRYTAELVPPVRAGQLDGLLGAGVPLSEIADPNLVQPYIELASRHFDDAVRHPHDGCTKAGLRRVLSRVGLDDRLRQRLIDRGGSPSAGDEVFSIRVGEGCQGDCSYCAIRFAAGPLRSKPLGDVLAEFDTGLALGYKDVRFVAGDLGCYGQDLGLTIVDLLREVVARPGTFELTLLDFDLRWLVAYADDLIALLAQNQSRVRSILLPMQSGSEEVLERMRRRHTALDAQRVLVALRHACPDIRLETHVLVGFPGETERDFEATMGLLRAVRFDHVVFYEYEDRPNTEASRMPGKVPEDVIRARSARARREIGGVWSALGSRVRNWSRQAAAPPPPAFGSDA
jgi:tRNA A37 methylthiotransferase MiaB